MSCFSMNGETIQQSKTTHLTDSHPLKSNNLAFLGNHIIEGHGQGIVIRTGKSLIEFKFVYFNNNLLMMLKLS